MLELFDAGGTRVKCGNNGVGGPFVFVLPDLGGSPSDYTSALGPHNITALGQLVFRVLIDNNDTYAKVDTITAGGFTADACGILHYGSTSDNVAIGFHATQPNDYLTWALQVWRGCLRDRREHERHLELAAAGAEPVHQHRGRAARRLHRCRLRRGSLDLGDGDRRLRKTVAVRPLRLASVRASPHRGVTETISVPRGTAGSGAGAGRRPRRSPAPAGPA